MIHPALWRYLFTYYSDAECTYLISTLPVFCTLPLFFISVKVAGLLARSQYTEGPASSHLATGFSWFLRVYKRKQKWFPRLQVATACVSCNHPDLNFLDIYFIFMYMHNNHCHRVTAHLQLKLLLLLLLLLLLRSFNLKVFRNCFLPKYLINLSEPSALSKGG
jgi:hypothetical protein